MFPIVGRRYCVPYIHKTGRVTVKESTVYTVDRLETIIRTYYVEATSIRNAVCQIESEDYSSVITSDASVATVENGPVICAKVNDDD